MKLTTNQKQALTERRDTLFYSLYGMSYKEKMKEIREEKKQQRASQTAYCY